MVSVSKNQDVGLYVLYLEPELQRTQKSTCCVLETRAGTGDFSGWKQEEA